jgi:type III pantothenate kinase
MKEVDALPSLLAMDVGNSNIVIGYYSGDDLLHQWRIHTDRKKLVDEYADLLDSLLLKKGLTRYDVDAVAVSNVVPSLAHLLETLIRDHFDAEPFFVGHHNKGGITIKIDRPEELGADLIAAGVAAVEKYGAPCIIIDFGTATTITAVNEKREFLGGAIAPGLAVSCEALYTYAPHLPRIKLAGPPSVIGTNTVHAMQAGIFTGYGHLIRGLVEDTRKALGQQVRVIATGGLAEVFDGGSGLLDVIDPRLVLDGIKILHQVNRPGLS